MRDEEYVSDKNEEEPLNKIEEAYKAYHHAKAAFERRQDEWLDGLSSDDKLLTCADYVIASAARSAFPEELEAVRVAAIQLDILREQREVEIHEAALLTHRGTAELVKAQTDAWLQRARLDKITADAFQARAEAQSA